jgi:hypothetical protein
MVKNGSKSPVPEDWVWNESSRQVYKIVPSDRVTPGAWGKNLFQYQYSGVVKMFDIDKFLDFPSCSSS